jgi:hypothetical protein
MEGWRQAQLGSKAGKEEQKHPYKKRKKEKHT